MKEVVVFFPDGKYHCMALEVDDMMEFLSRNVCSSCSYKGAIKWNPYNSIHECHNCGQAYVEEDKDKKEKVEFT
jgi:Zn ribbon nucleic-acid-binding protein